MTTFTIHGETFNITAFQRTEQRRRQNRVQDFWHVTVDGYEVRVYAKKEAAAIEKAQEFLTRDLAIYRAELLRSQWTQQTVIALSKSETERNAAAARLEIIDPALAKCERAFVA